MTRFLVKLDSGYGDEEGRRLLELNVLELHDNLLLYGNVNQTV